MAWRGTDTGKLWVAVNERDELGSDLVPDYMTVVKDGGFYGWPYSYSAQHVDSRVKPPRPDLVAKASVPDYALGPHTASLGLAVRDGRGACRARFRRGHVHRSARIVEPQAAQRLPGDLRAVRQRQARGHADRRADGFRDEDGDAYGRPVGVAIDRARRAAGRRRRRQRHLARRSCARYDAMIAVARHGGGLDASGSSITNTQPLPGILRILISPPLT